MKLKCTRKDCLYEWDYTGEKVYPGQVNCPYCGNKVRVPKRPDNKEV